LIILKKICGILVILGGIYFIYITIWKESRIM
jgi:hypothetical protein